MDKKAPSKDVTLPVLSTWARIRLRLKEPFAEFLGTCMMVLSLQGVVAQVSLADLKFGTYFSISIVTGIAAMLGVLIAGPVSGGHLNPSVTLAFVVFRGLSPMKAVLYFLGQMLGGFTGAAIVYGNYRSAIDNVEGFNVRTHKTAIIFSTYPQLFLTRTGQFFSEFVATAMLIVGIFAIFNPRNPPTVQHMAPLWIFLLILNIGAALGWETGYAMNMARDFAPRCFAYFAGYGNEVWSYGNYYSWVPVVAPLCGALAGGLIYDVLVFEGSSPVNQPWMGMWPILWVSKSARQPIENAISRTLPGP